MQFTSIRRTLANILCSLRARESAPCALCLVCPTRVRPPGTFSQESRSPHRIQGNAAAGTATTPPSMLPARVSSARIRTSRVRFVDGAALGGAVPADTCSTRGRRETGLQHPRLTASRTTPTACRSNAHDSGNAVGERRSTRRAGRRQMGRVMGGGTWFQPFVAEPVQAILARRSPTPRLGVKREQWSLLGPARGWTPLPSPRSR
jgi:hypothetical protein